MRKLFLLFIVFNYCLKFSYSQGTIRGKITDDAGEPIIGGVVALKSNKANAVSTDLDGNFTIKITDTTTQTLLISYIGYQPIEEVIPPFKGVIVKDFSIKAITQQIKEVVVEAKASKAKNYYMEKIKLNSSISIDFISSEIMKKTGDANVTAAVARVSGVSTNGGFITVRGIGDRYIKTTINGLRIPTLDPFTNNIKLDIFPASLIDNVILNKTASPDIPADWAGAFISVETKDYPDKLTINIESSLGYNQQSTLTNVISTQRSSTDWLGYDNGLRKFDHKSFVGIYKSPNQYLEFTALGLTDYYNSIGVTKHTEWNEDYTKLGYVQLGLLDKGKFNDNDAFKAAKQKYGDLNYSNLAYEKLNAEGSKSSQSLPNNWETPYRYAPLNMSQTFSIGNQLKLFGKPLGFLFGFRYGSNNQYDSLSDATRKGVDGQFRRTTTALIKQQVSNETNGFNGLMNLSYKYSPNHSIMLLFMPNFRGSNKVRTATDYADSANIRVVQNQFYEQRKQLIYQLKSEHYIPVIKLKMELVAGYTQGKSDAPDFKNIIGSANGGTFSFGGDLSSRLSRYYRELSENIFDSKFVGELPLFEKPGLSRKLKFGAAYQQNNRELQQYNYNLGIGPYNIYATPKSNSNKFLGPEDFAITQVTVQGNTYSTMNKFYFEDGLYSNHTIGNSSVKAAFISLDYTLVPRLRISGGCRVENAKILADVFRYDSLKLADNDLRRFQSGDAFYVHPGILNTTDFLPSVNLIYKLRKSDESPINIRLNYSKTIARPSIREYTETSMFDYELLNNVYGNASLKPVHISNYDIRGEAYFANGDNLSVSMFYKNFINHIEIIQTSSGYTWQNVDKSFVQGIEIEGSKNLGKHFEFRSNFTFVKSQTNFIAYNFFVFGGQKVFNALDTVTRSMYGQAPYVINAIFSYKSDKLGLTAAISYNIQGPRLVITSFNGYVPDIYEMPRQLIDIKVSKNWGKHIVSSISAMDILNTAIRRSYKYSEGYSVDYDKYRYGTTYQFSLGYKF